MRILFALAAVAALLAVSAPVSASAGPAACMGCDAIIAFCREYLGFTCVESSGPHADSRCALSLCGDVDRVCARFGFHCLA